MNHLTNEPNCFDMTHFSYTKKRIFEFAVVSVYIEDRLLLFLSFKSYLPQIFTIPGSIGHVGIFHRL